jgi:hypothetical protein
MRMGGNEKYDKAPAAGFSFVEHRVPVRISSYQTGEFTVFEVLTTSQLCMT